MLEQVNPLNVEVLVDNRRYVSVKDLCYKKVTIADIIDFVKPNYLVVIMLKDVEYKCRRTAEGWKCVKSNRWIRNE